MTIPLIILAAVIGCALGFFVAALVSGPGRDDAFRAGYSAGRAGYTPSEADPGPAPRDHSTPTRDLGAIERHWSDGTD